MGLELIDAGWLSILPPVVAITLALLTKEVYSSLFLGIFTGMCVYCFSTGGSLLQAVTYVFDMMAGKIGDNGYMIIFLVLLGSLVTIVTRSGGTGAYGQWAIRRIKTRRSAKLTTSLLGLLIFLDDGFNCLTVGTVMRPITDKHKISREKLSYLLDATAAPICIIAPISSWAVAVASEVEEAGGLGAFVQTIPFNLYALLTIAMVFLLSATGFDFGPMKRAETNPQIPEESTEGTPQGGAQPRGTVLDLVLPLVTLIVTAILGMAYVGGFFQGASFSEAIGENPVAGLTLGTFAGLLVALIMYLPRRLMTMKEFMTGIIDGIKTMIPALTILILAWALGGVCREMIGTGNFVSGIVSSGHISMRLIPAIVFAVAAFLSFSMGTAWGTFGILLPIVSMICAGPNGAEVLIPSLGATLAGSVYGDHCSPISDTTILASTGAQCDHLRHVETQLPYATLVAGVCFLGYIVAGFTRSAAITIIASLAILGLVFAGIALLQKRGVKPSGKESPLPGSR